MTYFPPGTLPDSTAFSQQIILRYPYSVVGAGADDVVIFNANAPFNFAIVDMMIYVSTAVALSTGTLRTATGGGGTAISDALSTGSTGIDRLASRTTVPSISTNGTLVFRRTSGNTAGEVVLTVVKT